MRSSTNVYLTALAIADISYLFFAFVLSIRHYPNIHNSKYTIYWKFYGLSHWFHDASGKFSLRTVAFTSKSYTWPYLIGCGVPLFTSIFFYLNIYKMILNFFSLCFDLSNCNLYAWAIYISMSSVTRANLMHRITSEKSYIG